MLTLHDALYRPKPHLAPNRLLVLGVKFIQKFAVLNAISIITDSNASAKDICEHLKVESAKISAIHLGVDLEPKRKHEEVTQIPYILAGGNRFRHKNWQNLLLAMQSIAPEKRPNLIITGGDDQDPLSSLIVKYSLAENVRLMNWVSEIELAKLLANASAVIIPSFFEGFSLGSLQAMAAEKPLLASDIPVHKEIAEDIAFFFDPESPESIAKTILEYRSNESELQTKLKLGKEKSKEFTWEKCADDTLKRFHELT